MLLGGVCSDVKLELVHTRGVDTATDIKSYQVVLERGGSGLCVAQKDHGNLRPDMQ